MGRAVLIGLSVLFTLAMIAASMTMNFLFGFGLGTTSATGYVWGGLSIASDGLKSVLPPVIAYQARRGHLMRMLVGLLILPLVLGYGVLSAVGFLSESRGLVVGSRANAQASVTAAEAELVAAERRLAGFGGYALPAMVESEIAGLHREGLWEQTQGCQEARTTSARSFCKRADALQAKLATAQEARVVEGQIAALKAEIRTARVNGAWREADAQGMAIASVLRVKLGEVRAGLSWFAAALVEAVSCFGLLAVSEAGLLEGFRRKVTREAASMPPWRLVGEAQAGTEAGAKG
jgi:hypothetical protein